MEYKWDSGVEASRFLKLWTNRSRTGVRHTKADWNERADSWEKELRENNARRQRSDNRIDETAAYLRSQGLLRAGDIVADIGCGPGRFAAEFAKSAGHVTGIDLSPRMAQYGTAFAEENGLDNISFISCDFKTVDVKEMKWHKQFDLVFSSITPALSDPECLEKAEEMSRAYCFNSSFVRANDSVAEAALSYALPCVKKPPIWNGQSFYALFNILWLRGRFPQVRYYKEYSSERRPAGKELAHLIVERYPENFSADTVIDKIYRYLMNHADDDGTLLFPIERWYGWILWDVRDSAQREYAIYE